MSKNKKEEENQFIPDDIQEEVTPLELDYDGEEIQEEPADNPDEELNWRDAGKVLKTQKDKYEKDFTIDTYFIKQKIDGLRKRYNDKERTEALHSEIISLSIK